MSGEEVPLEANRHENKGMGSVIMVVSGDAGLLDIARQCLETASVQLNVPESAADAPTRAKVRQPVLILLDGTMPDAVSADGQVLEALKGSPYTAVIPVVVLGAPETPEEVQLEWFRRGADDVLVRPANEELLRKKLAVLGTRYVAAEAAPDTLQAEGLVVDLRARKVTVNGQPVTLTRKEFDLLNMLLRRRGLVAYTTHLYHTVWGYGDASPVDSHTVKVHISSLRSKLGPELGRKIVNLPGLGYRFDDPAS
jgi:two-component system alkaline phosphatase synthesis response regulator PhoP